MVVGTGELAAVTMLHFSGSTSIVHSSFHGNGETILGSLRDVNKM
jgi:hypothetical protein